jgi:hypothetical protein
MGVNEKQAFIKGLNDKIAALETEKKSLGGDTNDKPDNVGNDGDNSQVQLGDNSGNVARISEIDKRIKDIDTEIALHQQGKILGNLNASAQRIAELSAEKKKLEAEKAILVQHI